MKKIVIVIGLAIVITYSIIGCSKIQEKEKGSKNDKTEIVEVNVSAAASLKEAMIKLEEEYKKINRNIKLIVNYGGSGSLQRQIEQGAPCDIFVSAGKKQMEDLKNEGLLLNDTYKNLVENELVIIVPKESKLTSVEDLRNNKVKHIAVGEANSVPVGKYTDEVLTNLKIKDYVEDKLVFAKDVKEVLVWTASKNAEIGFVYYTDTLNNDKIKIIEKVSKEHHSPIIYPVGVIKESKKIQEAKEFEEFLLSEKGQDILKEFGYQSIK